MADEEQPAWLRTSAPAGGAPLPPPTSSYPTSSAATSSSEADPPYKKTVKGLFTFFNLGFMVFLAATGALGVGSADSINDTGDIFVGIYMVLFAAIVFIYEISQFCPNTSLDTFMKRNFGYLYGVIGKGLFILFMGVLAFGLSSPRSLAIACGVLVCAWGPVQIAVYLKWPLYFDKKEKYQP